MREPRIIKLIQKINLRMKNLFLDIFFLLKIVLNLGLESKITFTLLFDLHLNNFKEKFDILVN